MFDQVENGMLLKHWTMPEVAVLREHYPVGGVKPCAQLLPHRTVGSIYQQARRAGLCAPDTRKDRKTWESNEQVDAAIRRAYQGTMDKNTVRNLADSLGYPRWWVSKRAAVLGFVPPRFKEQKWCAAEIAILEDRSTNHPKIIQKYLKDAGFKRTETAIVMQRKKRKLETQDPDLYTTGDLSLMFGVDRTTVMRWIESEGLSVSLGTGAVRKVKRATLRNWVRDHAQLVDLRKVDRFWFIDLAFNK